MTTTKTPSPEETGVYRCPKCPNVTRFRGIDTKGYGGPQMCDVPGNCPNRGTQEQDYCGCETTLKQNFEVRDGAIYDYEIFEGGADDSTIDHYRKIFCLECGAVVWAEEG